MKLEEFQGGLFETLIKEEEFEQKRNQISISARGKNYWVCAGRK